MVLLAGLVPSVVALFGIVKVYESRAVSLRTAEIQNQCTILTNQISASHYFEDTSQEVVNDSLNQLTNIYNGRVMVIDDQLRVVKDTYSLDEGKLDVSESVVRCMKGTSTNNYDKKNHYIEVTAPIAIPGEDQIRGVMLASVSTDSIEDSLDVLYTQGSVIIGLVMIFLTIVAVFAADRVVRPLHQIAATIENVSAGYSDDVLHVDTFTETKSISEAINKMMGRLKLLDDSREEFVSNVSHELKTPLTSISGYAELIETGMAKEGDIQHFASEIHKSANRLLSLINDIIELSQLDVMDHQLSTTNVSLNEEVVSCVDMLQMNAEKHNITIATDIIEKDCIIKANQEMIQEVIYNLCDNAIRYNKPEGHVWASVFKKDDNIILQVKDDGIGIPEDDLNRIFERFYRVDKARSKKTGGTGLWLAIVKHIAEQHEAEIQIDSTLGEGTTISIIFKTMNK